MESRSWILGAAFVLLVIGIFVVFVGSGVAASRPDTKSRAQLDSDCSQYLRQLNAEERKSGQPIYSFYRCENGGTAYGT